MTLQQLMDFGVLESYLFRCSFNNMHIGALQLHMEMFFCHTFPNLLLGQISRFLWWLAYASVLLRRVLRWFCDAAFAICLHIKSDCVRHNGLYEKRAFGSVSV